MKMGTFAAILVTYTASALLHVSHFSIIISFLLASFQMNQFNIFYIISGSEFSPGSCSAVSWIHHIC